MKKPVIKGSLDKVLGKINTDPRFSKMLWVALSSNGLRHAKGKLWLLPLMRGSTESLFESPTTTKQLEYTNMSTGNVDNSRNLTGDDLNRKDWFVVAAGKQLEFVAV